MIPAIETDRLILRDFKESDREPFAQMNSDPEVMRHFPALLSPAESDAMIERAQHKWREAGLCFHAAEAKEEGFIGFIGLNPPAFAAHFTPCVEIGWRLARHAWGKGYATEGARACLAYGFHERGLTGVVSFTVPANRRSRAVMERLGMTRDESEDFDHPSIAEGSSLKRHVLYRLRRDDWERAS